VKGSEGSTVKVATSAATTVTKTVKAKVKAIHPGETVTITGSTGSKGSVTAESISVGSGAVGGGSLGVG
jgi:ABC-type microcin C transport system duplicated ATPase subunit YejF